MDEKDKIRERYKLKDDEVQIIEADPILDIFEFKEKLRVCAYCRVSTDNIEQTSSYELQKAKYEELLQKLFLNMKNRNSIIKNGKVIGNTREESILFRII